VDVVTHLSDALHAPLALFETRRVPGQVDVHLGAEPLQVQALACRVRRADEPDLGVLNAPLDLFARRSASLITTLDE
jgi:hypothetical protein